MQSLLHVRRSADRGNANLGWLDSRHTFSFGQYHDPDHMGYRTLRVINEDRVDPEKGFGTHPHDNMEILSYVLEGAIEHKDSLGNGSVINPGDLQRMTAGTGVTHSEYNHSKEEPVHFLQIWIQPEAQGLEPGYEQKYFSDADKQGTLLLLASQDAREGSVKVHQDVNLYATCVSKGEGFVHTMDPKRHVWIQVTRGRLAVNGEILNQGDGAAMSGVVELSIEGRDDGSEALVFDLA